MDANNSNSKAGKTMKTAKTVAVTGGKDSIPMVDRDGRPILVGDTLRCVYVQNGAQRVAMSAVTDAHYRYCQIGHAGFTYDHATRRLIADGSANSLPTFAVITNR